MAIGDYPALMDPQTMGILSAAFGGLNASGPSLMPRSVGQIIGQAGQQGLGTYMQSAQAQRQNAQTEALIALEKQKSALVQSQVEQAAYQQAIQRWALNGMQGPAPMPGQTQGVPASSVTPAAPAGNLGAQMVPQAAPPQVSMGGPMAGVPEYLQRAAMLKTAGLPAMGEAVAKANEPIIGREGGLYKRDANGNMVIDPGFLAGERQRREMVAGIGNDNELVPTKGPNGEQMMVRKSDLLKMAGSNPDLVRSRADIQGTAPNEAAAVAAINAGGGAKMSFTLPKAPGIVTGPSTAATSAAEASGSEAGKVQEKIDTEAAGAMQSRKILGEMKTLSGDFVQGKVAPIKRALGEWAQALNLPGNWSEEIKSAESQQALQKLTAQMATAAMKQFTNRGTQMEFKTFLENNPNAMLTPGGFHKVLEFMDKVADSSIQKQQAYVEWRKSNPLEKSQDFLAEWNKAQNDALATPSPAPSNGAPKIRKYNPKSGRIE